MLKQFLGGIGKGRNPRFCVNLLPIGVCFTLFNAFSGYAVRSSCGQLSSLSTKQIPMVFRHGMEFVIECQLFIFLF